jgi:hypothetical protein
VSGNYKVAIPLIVPVFLLIWPELTQHLKVMVWYFASDDQKVVAVFILVVFVLVWSEMSQH